jgi:hypothetical protein
MVTQFVLRLRIAVLIVVAASVASSVRAQSTASIYGPHGISPLAVRQGILGSCYFHAALAAVAQAQPSVLRQAIHGNAQAGYRVHFVSGPDELVYTEDITYARAHNYDKSEGEWVTILMRAFAQRKLRQGMIEAIQKSALIPSFLKPTALSALQSSGPLLVAYDRAIRSVINQDGQIDRTRFQANLAQELNALGISSSQAKTVEGLLDHAGFYEELNSTVKENAEVFGAYRGMSAGGIPRSVITAFLGNAAAARVTSPLLLNQLTALHAGGKAIVAGSKNVSPFTTRPPEWYIPGHAYTVLDYDAATRTVTLRNPWGSRPGPDGVFRLSLAVFQQTYLMFSYSERSTR